MARFDVYRARHEDILLLDLQTSMLDILKSRIVVPLYPLNEMSWQIGKLNPLFTINGTTYVMATQRMASINVEGLGPLIGELSKHADAITAATDFAFQGF